EQRNRVPSERVAFPGKIGIADEQHEALIVGEPEARASRGLRHWPEQLEIEAGRHDVNRRAVPVSQVASHVRRDENDRVGSMGGPAAEAPQEPSRQCNPTAANTRYAL